ERPEHRLGNGLAVDGHGQRLAHLLVLQDRAGAVQRDVPELRPSGLADLDARGVLRPVELVDVGADVHEVDLAVEEGADLGVARDRPQDDPVELGPVAPRLVVPGDGQRLGRLVDAGYSGEKRPFQSAYGCLKVTTPSRSSAPRATLSICS